MPIIRLDAVVPEAISVADLLIWVYRDQKADRVTGKDLLTGAKPIFKDLGINLDSVSIADLGQAKKIEIDAENTTVIEGAGDNKAIQGRIDMIRKEIEITRENIKIEKKHVLLPHPIKALGVHPIFLKLKEGIPAEVTLHVVAEEIAAEENPPQS